MSKGKIAAGAIIGAIAGLIAGLLTAQKPGKQTRADLQKRASELKRQAARRAETLAARTSKTVIESKDKTL